MHIYKLIESNNTATNGNDTVTIKFENQLTNTAIDEALPLAPESNNSTVINLKTRRMN